MYHSRFYAKKDGKTPSRLCIADKLAICLEPWWFYLPRVWASGELWEYLARAEEVSEAGKYASMGLQSKDKNQSTYQKVREWHRRMVEYLQRWVQEHKDGGEDTWTPAPTHDR